MPKKIKSVRAYGLKNIITGELVSCATPDKYEIQSLYPTCMKCGSYVVIPVEIREIRKVKNGR